jgi:hypothetical protein
MLDDKLYLYAIISNQVKIGAVQGIDGVEVQKVPFGEIAAIVSRAPGEKIRPQRKNFGGSSRGV